MRFVFSDLEFIKLLAENKYNLDTVFPGSFYRHLYDILEDLLKPGTPFVHAISVEKRIEKIKINGGKVCRYLWRKLSAVEKRLITSDILMASEQGTKLLKKLIHHLPDIDSYRAEVEMQRKVLTLLRLRSRDEEPRISEGLGAGVVSKVITFNLVDEMDPEVADAIYLTVQHTGASSCVIRCSLQAIREEFHKDSNAHILVSVGHGYLREPGFIGYRCGPFTGTHDDVVNRVGEMLIQLPSLKEFVLTHCYYGATPKQLPRGLEISYMRSENPCESGQVTANAVWDPAAPARIPFKKSSFAAMLWYRLPIGMLEKGFALTATPQILNPYPYSCPTHFIAADRDTYHSGCTHGSFWEEQSGCRLSRVTTVTLVARPSLLLYARAAPRTEADLALAEATGASAPTATSSPVFPSLTS